MHGKMAGHAHKPFESPQKYLEFLERPERAQWQKPDAIVAALGLKGDETVVDIGAGSGYFSMRLARQVPRGRVIATDVQPEMVRYLEQRAASEGARNVQAVLATPEDPTVSGEASTIFLCDVLHHVEHPAKWLARMHQEARVGARLVVVEFKEGDLPQGPPASMKLTRAETIRLVTTAGFKHTGELAVELPYQYVVTFER
ncbi:MAG: methyltransferase domain-containing protein [Deltaproteobacteria bacterium]|nr:methyltransferase domain-containing protein [Deltaproteobacteria bacterium]